MIELTPPQLSDAARAELRGIPTGGAWQFNSDTLRAFGLAGLIVMIACSGISYHASPGYGTGWPFASVCVLSSLPMIFTSAVCPTAALELKQSSDFRVQRLARPLCPLPHHWQLFAKIVMVLGVITTVLAALLAARTFATPRPLIAMVFFLHVIAGIATGWAGRTFTLQQRAELRVWLLEEACPFCGYSRTGSVSAVCSECGKPLPPRP